MLIFLGVLAGSFAATPAAVGRDFDPMKFFTGRTRSEGVFTDRAGRTKERVKTETWGRMVNGELRLEQDLYIGNKPRQRRSWRMKRIDARHFEATANDMVGTALGRVDGNTFSWTFTLATKPKNPIYNVRMSQRMTLEPGGRSMVNRSTIRKFGFFVAGVGERFRKL